jgi:hypothetical protein
MLAQDSEAAVAWGERAIALAEGLGETVVLSHALTNVGTALLFEERVEEGRATLERGLGLARDAELHDHAARAYTNLASSFLTLRRYVETDAYLGAGIEYCRERGLDSMEAYMVGGLARSHLEQGRWDAAMGIARSVLRHSRVAPISGVTPLVVVGLVRARRGTADPWPPLDEALALSEPTGELQRLGLVAAARAEAAWLEGDPTREAGLVARSYELALEKGNSWNIGLAAFWLWRCGGPADPSERAAEPFALQIAGRSAEAAERWGDLGCPYERAMALAETDDEAAVAEAIRELNALDAAPVARRAEERLRALAGARRAATS